MNSLDLNSYDYNDNMTKDSIEIVNNIHNIASTIEKYFSLFILCFKIDS